jgi:hypothetical protein
MKSMYDYRIIQAPTAIGLEIEVNHLLYVENYVLIGGVCVYNDGTRLVFCQAIAKEDSCDKSTV